MLMLEHFLQDILESMGQFVDGLKFTGGSHSLMPKTFIKEITDMAHRHDVYVSTGDWAEHLLHEGPAAFKHYVEVRMHFLICKCICMHYQSVIYLNATFFLIDCLYRNVN